MDDLREKILAFIRMKGPSIPIHLSKEFSSNSIFIGAMLSELIARKRLKITTAKIGGSPLYYLEGQESRLGQLLYPYLKEVHKKVYDLLRSKKVLREQDLEPWQRVALSEIPDFSSRFTLMNGESYWRWYAVSDREIEVLLTPQPQIIQQTVDFQHAVQEQVHPEVLDPPEIASEKPVEVVSEPPQFVQKPVVEPTPKTPVEEKPSVKKPSLPDESFELVDRYFMDKNIHVLSSDLIRKSSDYEFLVEVPSEVGNVKFFAKFKSKKKLNDADLSLAQNTAYLKRLPLLFLYTGELTNKAQEYAEKNFITLTKI